jgi:histidinol-phosphate aminotransferase
MSFLRSDIASMAGYVPGFQPPDGEGFLKLNSNENPYPPSPSVVTAVLAELGSDGVSLRKYPSASSSRLRRIAGDLYGFDPSWVIMANGSDEVLNNLIRACVLRETRSHVHPSYSLFYPAEVQGARVKTFGLTDDFRIADFPERYEGKIFFLTTPNAPLGFAFATEYIEELAKRCSGLLVADEAYVDFADQNALDLVRKHENVVVTRTLSKSYSGRYAIAGQLADLEIIAALIRSASLNRIAWPRPPVVPPFPIRTISDCIRKIAKPANLQAVVEPGMKIPSINYVCHPAGPKRRAMEALLCENIHIF